MTDVRTVLDVLSDAYWRGNLSAVLGIDPDMSFEQFARWLRYGKKADELGPAELITNPHGAIAWNACLAAIKGDD